jgi:hypothetical protein
VWGGGGGGGRVGVEGVGGGGAGGGGWGGGGRQDGTWSVVMCIASVPLCKKGRWRVAKEGRSCAWAQLAPSSSCSAQTRITGEGGGGGSKWWLGDDVVGVGR